MGLRRHWGAPRTTATMHWPRRPARTQLKTRRKMVAMASSALLGVTKKYHATINLLRLLLLCSSKRRDCSTRRSRRGGAGSSRSNMRRSRATKGGGCCARGVERWRRLRYHATINLLRLLLLCSSAREETAELGGVGAAAGVAAVLTGAAAGLRKEVGAVCVALKGGEG